MDNGDLGPAMEVADQRSRSEGIERRVLQLENEIKALRMAIDHLFDRVNEAS